MKLILEARHLFDGSVAAVAHKATHSASGDQDHHDPSAYSSSSHHRHFASAHENAASTLTHAPGDIPGLAPNPHATEILFVDPRVANWQALAKGVAKDVQVVLIDPNRDGLAQVTAALKGRSDLTAIHFLTYGESGQIELGNSPITTATLTSHAGEVASWGDHLATNADIEFWGCDVGQGANGLAFVDSVHALTGAQVGASTDATGAAQLGGDWTLERTTGVLAIGAPFSAASMAAYQGVLDTPVPTVSFDPTTVPGDVLLGSTFTETVTFSNTAANAPGFGPFIDLYVPKDSAQSATLTSASFLGATVSFQAVTISNVAGHGLGALNPLMVDSSGNPMFVAAPAGYQAGDTMYVLQLPFGSFTPGQPAAQIQLTFSLDNSTELSSMHSGQPLNITAVGGFQYGADALNDPATDPPIIGTASAQASSTVSLLDVSATTDLHESETATGPDYPFNYVVTIKPAPVTTADPVTNLDFTFTLPAQVEYTSGTIAITGPGGATGTATFHPGTNAAGGTVTVHFTSLGTDAGDTPTVIQIPVFVPQFDANGNAVLPTNGASQTINTTAIYSYTGSWEATAASVDHSLGEQTIAGDSSTNTESTSFIAKSLAIQVTDNAIDGNIVPGEPVTYSIHFEVSDYFSLNNLNIANVIGDGITLLAPGAAEYVTPTLTLTSGGTTQVMSFGDVTNNVAPTINTETVAASGSNAVWNYTRDDSAGGTGATTVNFDVGMLIGMMEGGALGSILQGGAVNGAGGATQGVISFVAQVLDKYTNANSGNSLREKDSITDTVSLAGTSATVVSVNDATQTITNANLGTVSDDSSVTDTVAPGSMVLSVIAVNGDTSNTTDIKPGDTVTYGLTYSLTTGDYGNLDLTAYLPEPVFSTTDPTSTGSNVSTFTQDTSSDAVPAAGTYKVIDPLSGETSTPAVVIDGTSNSISFNFGNRDDPTNAAGQQVQVQFSVVASDKPFADGLALTSQGTSTYTNAAGATVATAAIKQTPLEEPEVTVKTGVVSVLGDGGASKGTYAADTSNPNPVTPWTAQTGIPPSGATGPFAPAGTAAGTLFSTAGAANPALALASDDLNVAGADGGDLVRVVSTVDNEGHATAFDVTVQGTLPPGFSTANVSNFAIYNSAGTQIDTGITAAQYFSAGGVKLGPATGVDPGIAAGGQVYVVYDLALPVAQQTAETLTASSSVVNWASVTGGVAAGEGFVSGTGAGAQALGESAAALSDNATIGISAPTIAKTVVSGSDTDVPLTSANDVVLGETVTYQVTVTLPEGQTSNNSGDVTVTDTLQPGMSFGSIESITFNGVTSAGGTPTSISTNINGLTAITIDLGNTLTNSQVDTDATVIITYTATVTSTDTPAPGTGHANDAVLSYGASQSAAASTTLTELEPAVTEAITATDTHTGTTIPANGTVFSNEDLTYTVTLTNNGNAPANDLADLLKLPSGLTYDAGTLTYVSGGTGESVSVSDASDLNVALATLGAGESATFTFSASVNPNQAAGTSLAVDTPADSTSGTYYSLPGTAQGHVYSDSASDTVSTGQITPVLSITGESNNTDTAQTPTQTDTQTSTEATVGEVVTLHGVVQIPEGSNPATLTFDLPAGLQYLPGNATIALVSPNGDLVSTLGSLSGLTQYQDSNPGGANYISSSGVTTTGDDVATFRPVDQLPAGVVSTSGNTVTIDLGTLSNNDGSATGNYVVIEFNAVVANVAANKQGAASLQTSFAVDGTSSNDVSVAVEEPTLTVTKTATAVDNADGTVTYQITVHNTGDSTAYNVGIDDPAVANESGVTFLSDTGSGTGGAGAAATTGTDLNYVIGQLGANGTEVITYSVQVAPGSTVQNDTAGVTWQSLAGQQTFDGSTAGAVGTATGPRDFDPASNPPDAYRVTAATDLGTAQGRVWQDLGNDTTTFSQTGGSADTPLAGITVTATITQPGGTIVHETTTTAADGTYTFGALPDGTVSISLAGAPAADTLVYDPDGSIGTSPPTATFTSAGDAHNNVDFSFQAPDTAPVIANWGGGVDYTEGGPPVPLSRLGASVSDSQIDALGGDYGNTTLTIQRYTGGVPAPASGDVFSGTGQLSLVGATSGAVMFGGSDVGSFTETNGQLAITFASGATATTVNNVLDNLGYSSSDTSTVSTGIQIGATLDDHNTTGQQGTGGDMTSALVFATVNELPSVGGSLATFVEPNNTGDPAAAAAAAVAVDPTLAVTSSDTFSSATVHITNDVPGEDVLVAGTLPAGVTASFNSATGTMTLSGTGMSAATLQAALQAVQYYDSSDTPITTPRDVTFSVTDSTTGATTAAAAAVVDVVATNDSPVLNGVPVALNDATEDAGAPAGAVGTLVSQLTGSGNVSDPDGASAHDGATPGPTGIAITAADTTEGSWWYSTNNGTTWTEFASSGQTAVSAANALHLVADSNTRIYFDPTPNWNGAVQNALTFRAWDQFDGAANGSLSALPSGTLGQGENTASSAYSSASESVALVATAVNDAPVASGQATLATTVEDTTAPPGDTVAHLFGGNFSDSADQQQSAGNPTGSVANTLAGVAITGNAANPDEGAWQYSTDNGATWTSIPATGLSDSNALVLSASAEVRFAPAPDFNGVPGQLTTRLIDSSDTAVTGSVTGAELATEDTALNGVDATHNGGTTALSATTVVLDTTVTPVNDAPVASGSATLGVVSQINSNPPGSTIGNLFGGNFNDSADQQQSAANPTGSTANSLAGIAITGNGVDPGQGTWQYSSDGGKTWTSVPSTGLSNGDAIVLSSSDSLRFKPSSTFSGTPGPLEVRLIDSSDGPVTDALGVDLGAVGGTTQYSASTVDLTAQVTSSHRPFFTPPQDDIPDFNAPNDYNKLGDNIEPGDSGALTSSQFPDDGLTPPAEGRGYQTSLYGEPIIPQVWLTGSVGNRFVIEEQHAIIPVPSNLFDDTYPGANLEYDARGPGGGPLPQWLEFDSRNLTFSGTPPLGTHGTIEVEIVGRDQFGNQATATFEITVGRESHDLDQMLERVSLKQPVAHPAPAHHRHRHAVHHEHAQQVQPHHAQHQPVVDSGRRVPADVATTAPPQPGRSAFSAQLRDAGPVGRILQARQILEAIVEAAPFEFE